MGLFTDTANKADVGAKGGTQGGTAQASAGANASSANNLDFARQSTTQSRDLSVTNTGSAIGAGGNVVINATNRVTVQGSDIAGDKGVSVTGKDIATLRIVIIGAGAAGIASGEFYVGLGVRRENVT